MNTDSKRTLVFAFAAAMLVLCDRPPSALAQAKAAAGTGTVYVSRPSQWVASLLSIDVYVNGKKVGSISDGKCMKVTLPAGRHRIQGYDALWTGQLWGSETGSVGVNVGVESVSFVSITPTMIYPGQYIIYPATVSSKGRSCWLPAGHVQPLFIPCKSLIYQTFALLP
jgi:hypothetical protein